MLHTRISPAKMEFLCGKKFPSLLKEIFFLPQSGRKYSAKRISAGRKAPEMPA